MVRILRAPSAVFVAMVGIQQTLAAPGAPVTSTVTTNTKTETGVKTETAAAVPAAPAPTAVLIPPAPSPTGLSQIARFENDVGDYASGSAINNYLGIFWKGMSLVKTNTSDIENLVGLVPNSPPNYASFSPRDLVTFRQGIPEMTTVYEDSMIESFNLHSFFYGCASKHLNTNLAPLGPTPVSCEIIITGFNTTGGEVKKQTFEFREDGFQQQMPEAVLEGFDGLQMVQFDVGPDDNTAMAFIDSVHFEVFGS